MTTPTSSIKFGAWYMPADVCQNYQNVKQRNLNNTKEGVIVNSFIKDEGSPAGIYLSQDKSPLIEQDSLKKDSKLKQLIKNPFLPVVLAPLLVLGSMALLTKSVNRTLQSKLANPGDYFFPGTGRNININDDDKFMIFLAYQDPSIKNVFIATTVITTSACAFVMKNFVDGFKEIWVKKQEANVKRDLEEKLIDVETRIFSGKNQIIRNMMTGKNTELKAIKNSVSFKGVNPELFSSFNTKLAFSNNNESAKSKQNFTDKNWFYIAAGLGTLAVSSLAILSTFRNIKSIAQNIEKSRKVLMEQTGKKPIKDSVFQELPTYMAGNTNKIGYYSYVSEFTAHLYTYLVYPTQFTRDLFIAMAAFSGLSYIGTKAVEAVKEVQIKKANAGTEFDLQNRLIDVELRNFSSKKESYITPLIKDYKMFASQNPKNNAELDKMHNNVLNEIKNGPPFVYS